MVKMHDEIFWKIKTFLMWIFFWIFFTAIFMRLWIRKIAICFNLGVNDE